ncbi:MAG: hypothetical protein AB2A00_20965 [Myxococcota bacterium]
MSAPTSIRLTLCKGALTRLFTDENWNGSAIPDVVEAYARTLRGALARHYGTQLIRVEIRPDQVGRMRLVFGGTGVDDLAETARIWALAQEVSRWVYA